MPGCADAVHAAADVATDPALAARIDATVARLRARDGVPGLSLVLARDGRVLLVRGYGCADPATDRPVLPATPFPLASISKHFAAATLLALEDDGRVDLDAPLGRYLPEYAAEPRLHVRNLLQQTAGLSEFLAWPDAQEYFAPPPERVEFAALVARIHAEPRTFAPGTRWAYSNGNYTIAAAVVERVAGRHYADVQRERLFVPLGLAELEECARWQGAPFARGHSPGQGPALEPTPAPFVGAAYTGNGGACGTARALADWFLAVLGERTGVADLRARLAAPARLADGRTVPYALGLSVRDVGGGAALAHAGNDDGHSALLLHLVEPRLTLVLLANRGYLWTPELALPIVRAVLGEPEPRRARQAPPARLVRALAGRWHDGLFEYRIDAPDGELRVHVPPFGAPLRFRYAGDGRFEAEDAPETLVLRAPVRGAVRRFEFDWLVYTSYAERVR